jgi:hypothetical protein
LIYRTLLSRAENCEDSRGNRLGTHTLRKTGYLFATWGVLKSFGYFGRANDNTTDSTNTKPPVPVIPELAYANILASARHSSVQNAGTYLVCIIDTYIVPTTFTWILSTNYTLFFILG